MARYTDPQGIVPEVIRRLKGKVSEKDIRHVLRHAYRMYRILYNNTKTWELDKHFSVKSKQFPYLHKKKSKTKAVKLPFSNKPKK